MFTKWQHSDYPYLYDTHVHTSEGSACGKNTAAEMVGAYKKANYTGIIITDHFFYGNTAPSRTLSWCEWVNAFCLGYEHAYEEGKKVGLKVLEPLICHNSDLIYGLDKQWLLSHPEIKDATIPEQFALVHESGGMVIHAHPYREEPYIDTIRLFPKFVDGVEVLNACHSNSYSPSHYNVAFDQKAATYAVGHHFPVTAGSDMHHTSLFGGGMAFHHPLNTIQDYISAVQKSETCLLTNGEQTFLNTDYLEPIMHFSSAH